MKLDLGNQASDVVFLTSEVSFFVLAPLDSFVCKGTMSRFAVRVTLGKRCDAECNILRLQQISILCHMRFDAMIDDLLVVEIVGDAIRSHEHNVVVLNCVLEELLCVRCGKVATALHRGVEVPHSCF